MIATSIDPTESAPTAEQSAGERVAQLQKTISPSRLSLFLQCRLKFFFRYVAKIEKPKTAALRHVGSAVHAALKAWNAWLAGIKQPLSLKQLHDEYSKAWSEADEPVQWEPGEEDDEKKTGWRLVETYMRESKIPPTLKPDAVEVPVEADLHQHGLPILIGVLDLVQEGVDHRLQDHRARHRTPNVWLTPMKCRSAATPCSTVTTPASVRTA